MAMHPIAPSVDITREPIFCSVFEYKNAHRELVPTVRKWNSPWFVGSLHRYWMRSLPASFVGPVTSMADLQMDEVRLLEPIGPMPTLTDCERDLAEIAS
jgi:hypothetical protein